MAVALLGFFSVSIVPFISCFFLFIFLIFLLMANRQPPSKVSCSGPYVIICSASMLGHVGVCFGYVCALQFATGYLGDLNRG